MRPQLGLPGREKSTPHRAHQKRTLLYLSGFGLLAFIWIATTFAWNRPQGPDAPGCRSIYMFPSYMRIEGFDESHTRFAQKYSLFLYREQGKDPDFTHRRGIPVLFIPGNAGSYKQARSVAAAASTYYFDQLQDPQRANLDVFTADFNEDLTAFHGRTMLDQAEYVNEAVKFILSLYEADPPASRPTSVILLGHSMGGIVARTVLTLPNYMQDSVNTIITLASPHSAAPATFDGDILRIYSEIDNFWRAAFVDPADAVSQDFHAFAKRRLQDVALVSITGGALDSTLPADYTQTDWLLPNTNSLAVFTTGIPDVYTPIDHLAIVWCDQLRKKLVDVLFAITNTDSRSACTVPLQERMLTFRRLLLSGFEDSARDDYDAKKLQTSDDVLDVNVKLDKNDLNSNVLRLPIGKNTEGRRQSTMGRVNFFNIRGNSDADVGFTVLSSLPVANVRDSAFKDEASPAVLGCKNPAPTADGDHFLMDYTSSITSEIVEFHCMDLSNDSRSIPRSMADSKSLADSSYGGEFPPFHVLQLDAETTALFDAILVIESPASLQDSDGNDFVVAQLQPRAATKLQLGTSSIWSLILRGFDVSLPSQRPLAVDFAVPSAWSSLLAYNVRIDGLSVSEDSSRGALFAPFIRQSVSKPHETKWHIAIQNSDTRYITFHGNSPFVQYSSAESPPYVNLQLWTDSTVSDETPLDIYISVDILESLRLLVLRYRLALISFPVATCFMVFAIQLAAFVKDAEFISFGEGLAQLCAARVIRPLLVALSILTPLCNVSAFNYLISFLNPVGLDEISYTQTVKNTSFLALRENFLFILGPLFFVISLGLVNLVFHLITLLGVSITKLLGFLLRRPDLDTKLSSYDDPPMAQQVYLKLFKTRKQLLAAVALLVAVSLYVPYQFAYVICCVLQVVVVIKCFVKYHFNHRMGGVLDDDPGIESRAFKLEAQISKTPSPKRRQAHDVRKSTLNYQVTLLNMMLWLVPIDAPVIVVFIHNMSVRWTTPFSSHHNLFAILPILALVVKHASGRVVVVGDRTKRLYPFVCAIAVYAAVFAILFGIKNLFFLHHLFSIISGCIFFMF